MVFQCVCLLFHVDLVSRRLETLDIYVSVPAEALDRRDAEKMSKQANEVMQKVSKLISEAVPSRALCST